MGDLGTQSLGGGVITKSTVPVLTSLTDTVMR
jgi:hypothetical protein